MEKIKKIPRAVVVNDDLTQLNILCGLLKKAGVEYTSFTGAQEALLSLEQSNPPEILISDIYMPGGLDGWRLCRVLRSPDYRQFNQVPILIVSATYSGEEPEKITSDLGANAFLPMPLDGKLFIETVHSLINGKHKRNALRVLVVEDSKVISSKITIALQTHGFLVDKVDSLGQALSQIEQPVYDIAIADFHLNVEQGAALLKNIQTQSLDCVCVMLTADDRAELALNWQKKGVDVFIRTPVDPEYVINQCERVRHEYALLRVQDILEIRTNQLRESEEKYRKLAEDMPAFHSVFLPNGNLTFVNNALGLLAGLAPEALIGQCFFDYLPPEDRLLVKEKLASLNPNQPFETHEQTFNAPDGKKHIIEWTNRAFFDELNQAVLYQAVGIDITERKRMEEKLAEEAARRKILMDQSKDGIVIINQDGKVVDSNCKFAEMLGYPIESMTQLSVFDWEYLTPRKRLKEMIRTVDETGDHFETQHRRKDGSIYDVEISTNAAWFDDQKLIFCVCRDISERKKVEQDLYLKSLVLDQIQDHVTITDLQGNITYINQAETKTLGLSEEQIVGKSTSIYGENVEKGATQREIVENTLRDGTWRCEIVNYSKDGSEHYMDCRTQVVRDADGNSVALCGIATDITERKKIEESLILSEEKFSKAFRISPDSININRLNDGLYLDINEGFTHLTGYTASDVKGKTSLELDIWVDPQDRKTMVNGLKEFGKVENLEAQFRIKDGSIRTCLVSAQIIEINQELCILSIIRDISDRKLAEKKLIESEQKFTRVFNDAPVWIAISDLKEGKYLDVNEEALRASGFSREEVVGQSSVSLGWISANDRQRMIQRIHDHGKITDMEMAFHAKDGRVLYGLVNGEQMDLNGHSCLLTITADITEQKLEQERLKESEENLRKAQQYAHIGSWSWNIKTNQLQWSDEMFHIFGFEKESFSGNLAEIISNSIHPEDRAKVDESNLSVIKYGKPIPLEYRIVWPDQSVHTVWAEAGEMVKDDTGSIIQLNGTIQDITERKQAELKISEQLNELQRWHSVTMGREDRIMELKREVNTLLSNAGFPPRYPSVE